MAKKTESQICIVTVTGKDKVGIIARLSTAMAKMNINIVDVNQKIMEKYFVMTMACDMAKATVDMQKIKERACQDRQGNGPDHHLSARKYF